MDPSNGMMKDNENVEYFSLYNGYFDDAIKNYNEKKYGSAFKNFKEALAIEEFIKSKNYSYKGYSFPALDTQLLQNTSLAAMLNKDTASAIFYDQKLADAKLKGEAFRDIYVTLVEYFSEKKDTENMNKYLTLGKELYPADDYWVDFDWRQAGDDKTKKEQVLAKYPNNFALYYNYSAELFNELYTGDSKPANYSATQDKLDSTIRKAIALDPSRPEANLLEARHLANKVYDLTDAFNAIKGKTPNDTKKKNELMSQINSVYDEMLKYATDAYNFFDKKETLKPSEKGSFKVATNLLIGYWEYKKDNAKVKQFQDKMDSIK